jgi:hypothetical protein
MGTVIFDAPVLGCDTVVEAVALVERLGFFLEFEAPEVFGFVDGAGDLCFGAVRAG